MGIKTRASLAMLAASTPLKNFPTTWGLRLLKLLHDLAIKPLKNLPTTWGLRLSVLLVLVGLSALKNLPTTWGLRPKVIGNINFQIFL